jgi:hypothetical protein
MMGSMFRSSTFPERHEVFKALTNRPAALDDLEGRNVYRPCPTLAFIRRAVGRRMVWQ